MDTERLVVRQVLLAEVLGGIGMNARLKVAVIVLLISSCYAGCAPKESFSWIDRNCFVADWTNHYSCLSCCRNGGCGQAQPAVEYPMLVLGDQPEVDASTPMPIPRYEGSESIVEPVETSRDER